MRIPVLIKYVHPKYQIGLEDIRNAWLLENAVAPVKLKTIIWQGRLAYRLPVSGKRISYLTLKKGLVHKELIIYTDLYLLPF